MSSTKRRRPGGSRGATARGRRPAVRDEQAVARAREAADRRAREAARRRRVRSVTAAVVGALLVAAVVAVLVLGRDEPAGTASTTGPTPATATGPAGGLVLPGTPRAGAPTLDVWLDFQCPACRRMEETSGAALVDLAARGEARVVVHTLSFLDGILGNDSSSRAAQGAAAAADQGRLARYVAEVFARQPEREGQGYTDAELEAAAVAAGVPDVQRWRRGVADGTYAPFVTRVQEAMPPEVRGTPTLQLTPAGGQETRRLDNAEVLTPAGPGYLRAQVASAAGGS